MKNVAIIVLLALIGVGAWFQWGPPAHRAVQQDPPTTTEAANADPSPGATVPAAPLGDVLPLEATPAVPAVAGSPGPLNAATPTAAVPLPPGDPLSSAEFAKRVADSQRHAIARYPDLGKPNSGLNIRFVSRYKQMMAERSPKLRDPDWPLQLAEETVAAAGRRETQAASQQAAALPGPAFPTPNPDADKPPLIALNVTSLNAGATYDIHWLTYYDGYDIAGHANKALDLDARNLSNHASQVVVQWIFTGRKHGRGGRFIFDMGSGNWDMKPNQTTHLGVRSADLASRTIWFSDYGYGYYSGSEIDGWIVLARFKDKVLRMVGSSGTLESMVGTPEFEKMIADYKAAHHG